VTRVSGSSFQFALEMAWALVLFTRVARQTGPWAFESVVLVALLAWPIGLVELNLGMVTAIAWMAGIIHLLAPAVCGWLVAMIVSRWTARRVLEPIAHGAAPPSPATASEVQS
jgi:hypothetical protein